MEKKEPRDSWPRGVDKVIQAIKNWTRVKILNHPRRSIQTTKTQAV